MVALKRVRQRSSYKEFKDLLAIVQSGNIEKIMTHVYNMIDSHRGYGYKWISCAASNSLKVVLDELTIEKASSEPLLLINHVFSHPELQKMVEKKLKEGQNGILYK